MRIATARRIYSKLINYSDILQLWKKVYKYSTLWTQLFYKFLKHGTNILLFLRDTSKAARITFRTQREVGGAHFSTKQPRADIIQQTFDTDTFNAVYRYTLSRILCIYRDRGDIQSEDIYLL